MGNSKATREAFGDTLVELGEKNENIVVVSCDLEGSTKVEGFIKKFPDKSVRCGIAEANGVGISAGLALEGFRPFLCSFGHFITGKYLEMFQSIAYNQAGVVIVGTHSGVSIGQDGPTQMGLRDIGVMRLLHNMSVIQPADYNETKQVVEYLASKTFPVYLRLGRKAVPEINSSDYKFEFGKGVVLRDGKDFTILATGTVVSSALEASKELSSKGIDTRVINIHTLKPIDKELILKCAKETKGILAIDDHYIIGSLGSIAAEIIAENGIPTPVHACGVKDFGQSGAPEELYREYGLDKEGIVNKIIKLYD